MELTQGSKLKKINNNTESGRGYLYGNYGVFQEVS
ncbi:hypothetical protein SAMN04490355_100411 [Pelosinus propionicus DSM 13327]|uniref:Uncharacterized protein n=1 Tax=Pelosinus propionicus DSM 13327 TaxID=1123291 RepID=A0A1I4HJJ6_9FIRM|nr:hypothetical protein SAMN04490355_100411 [Pelosinus propionicus DSM 13327]